MADTWLYVPEEPGAGSVEDDMCTLQINIQHEVIPSIICSTCFTAGLIYTLFGYCCFKMVTFFCGFLSGCAAVLLLHHREPLLEADLCSGTKAGLGLGVGVLCGLMSMLLPRLGLVLCGLQLGGLLSVGLLLPAAQCGGPAPAWLPLGVTAAAGSVAALLALRWQKLLSVIYTCVFGATTVTLCVDYLLGRLALPDQVYDLFCEVSPRPLCWFNWTIAGMWPVLALVGGAVQWGVTARGVSHTESE
ncbi:transmembrane protein 198-like, partial [Cottoperca gobio]|uniref:Transmembrane protein 198 n=1 Tax=Cottoperca gobio TaxID=56716 RepID=A0A6J2PDZ4_COTGO